ncbi:toll/interleukin-1 receptor domain-containing protein [Mesorhizobium sp. M0847]|uniref:toll/interleukin-1 receptor domain-containing protein n=1 Tax=unclassified Mesorhizobium TaxID=325217 RepID=UPI003337BA93
MAKIFFSYSHADEALRDQLERQLSVLRRQGAVEVWHDRRIGAGQELNSEIDRNLEDAEIILLLVSADFLASDYCYEREMMRALQRHREGSAIVIPVILRACPWHDAPFGKLMATPTDGRPITQWPDRDQAFLEVANAIRDAAKRIKPAEAPTTARIPTSESSPSAIDVGPRTSNLRLAKQFSDRDKDRFKHEVFDFMAKFFENSLTELEARNSGIETNFRRIDANRFTAGIYKNGKATARCTVFMGGGSFVGGISYVATETTESNTYNENLRVEADDQTLYLCSMGMAQFGGNRDVKHSAEGAAELYWSLLISHLR